ncbi:uncharacterized protein I206_100160 [Kwoniella pini CBS 10737]|uniref:Uncharacterized protein n=1 Tax=Kwoniella pini CBS 10737 TaxID=1296096 RepID=A0A1B9IEJ9_9TREE|nr:uncharacterized protein I206_01168 [Kwoniella pini CBS 10737]OCF53861.1 hypothetical protein I206_01168 [Kwoniella pini CBS 10737]
MSSTQNRVYINGKLYPETFVGIERNFGSDQTTVRISGWTREHPIDTPKHSSGSTPYTQISDQRTMSGLLETQDLWDEGGPRWYESPLGRRRIYTTRSDDGPEKPLPDSIITVGDYVNSSLSQVEPPSVPLVWYKQSDIQTFVDAGFREFGRKEYVVRIPQ